MGRNGRENVGGRHVGYGDGVYRSLDGGADLEEHGSRKSPSTSAPSSSIRGTPKVIYVAVTGSVVVCPVESAGLFKSIDGGETWEKILGGGEYTGVNEVRHGSVAIRTSSTRPHTRDSGTVAALDQWWAGDRHPQIHGRLAQPGASWRAGLPKRGHGEDRPRASRPRIPDVVYATIELAWRKGGFYRSDDGGESWEKRSDYVSGGTGPHYYQEIVASARTTWTVVYQMDVFMRVTEERGRGSSPSARRRTPEALVTTNALVIDPEDPELPDRRLPTASIYRRPSTWRRDVPPGLRQPAHQRSSTRSHSVSDTAPFYDIRRTAEPRTTTAQLLGPGADPEQRQRRPQPGLVRARSAPTAHLPVAFDPENAP